MHVSPRIVRKSDMLKFGWETMLDPWRHSSYLEWLESWTEFKNSFLTNVDVSENRGYPQIINFNRVFHYKPSILGYPYFWKHPYSLIWANCYNFPQTWIFRAHIGEWESRLNLVWGHEPKAHRGPLQVTTCQHLFFWWFTEAWIFLGVRIFV